jgi:hypothetical protein
VAAAAALALYFLVVADAGFQPTIYQPPKGVELAHKIPLFFVVSKEQLILHFRM